MKTFQRFNGFVPGRQAGAVTLLTAVLILFLLTAAILYSSRNALFDQRSASNEDRYRRAFNAAEGAVSVVQEYLVAETSNVVADDGWLDIASPVWTECTGSGDPELCDADIDISGGIPGYYIENVGAIPTIGANIQAAINASNDTQPDVTARVAAALQFVLAGDPADPDAPDAQAVFMLYGYGWSDCSTLNDISTCQGEAEVAVPLATFQAVSSPPDVPFTSRSFVDSNGGWTVVANPNGGGVGVPVSMWLNFAVSDGNDEGIDFDPGAGSWQTCEMEEWYGVGSEPPFAACPGSVDATGVRIPGNHGCVCDGSEVLSGSVNGSLAPNIDLLIDPSFPDDLFLTFFGVPKAQYQIIKDAATILDDCTTLDETSEGVYWITGECNTSGQIGHYDNPVVLVGAGGFDINGGTVYGLVFCSDAESADPTVEPIMRMRGNGIVYGAIVVDCVLSGSNGTFDLVYNGDIIGRSNGLAGVGAASGGWRDFDIPAYTGN